MPTQSRMFIIVAAALALIVACGPGAQNSPASKPPPYATGSLDQMLAPIALYPDQLLAQMLMCATEPAKIAELSVWLAANQTLKGTPLQDAAVRAGFEPSFVALSLFPQVVAKMAEQIGWTTLLGQSFTSDRNAVFVSIQKLRQQARNVGTLKSTPQQQVETKTVSSGEEVIVIEPTNPQVVYVPQYNTEVVYTQPPTTTVIVEEDNDADVAVAAGLIGFTAGIAIGASMDNHYYYGPYGWYGGAYMYNEAWDDYYDHREDAREDWIDHREDLTEERTDRFENRSDERSDRLDSTQQQRTDRQQTRQENRPEAQAQRGQRTNDPQAQRTERSAQAQTATAQTQSASRTTNRTGSAQARGYSEAGRPQTVQQRGGSSDAFGGYSSGASQRAASARGQQTRSRSGGGGGRRR